MADQKKQGASASDIYFLTPRQTQSALMHLVSEFDPVNKRRKRSQAVLVRGAPGVGKSDIIRQAFDYWGRRIVDIRLGQYDPSDLKGLPVRLGSDGSPRVKWQVSSVFPSMEVLRPTTDLREIEQVLPWDYATGVELRIENPTGAVVVHLNGDPTPDFLAQNYEGVKFTYLQTNDGWEVAVKSPVSLKGHTVRLIDKAGIFLDELTTAEPGVQNAALQLVLDRRINEYDVPPGCPVVAAGNRESDGAFVQPMSRPLANRLCIVNMTSNLDEWVDWGTQVGVHPTIVSYVKNFPDHFAPKFNDGGQQNSHEEDISFPSPRSWTALSEQMAETAGTMEQLPVNVRNSIVVGFVGRQVGQNFISYLEINDRLPKAEDILAGKPYTLDSNTKRSHLYGLAISLVYRLVHLHGQHYNPKINFLDMEKQSVEWKTASTAFMKFLTEHAEGDIAMFMCSLATRRNVTYTSFIGGAPKTEREKFVQKYGDSLMKVRTHLLERGRR